MALDPTPVEPSTPGNDPTLPLEQLVLGPNPRQKQPSDEAIAEMAASAKKFGIIEPLIVRPAPKRKDGAKLFEIVCGQTRFKAATIAGLLAVPVRVRAYSDTEALEVQLIENIKRNDMHPIDEGEAFKRLIDKKAHTAETLSKTIGKSVRWVYNRLEFTKLTPKLRQAFLDEEITATHAELLARLEAVDQKRIDNTADEDDALWRWDYLPEIYDHKAGQDQRRYVRSVRDVTDWIERHVRLAIETTAVQHLLPAIDDAQVEVQATHARILQVATTSMLPTDPALRKRFEGVLTDRHWKLAGGKSKCEFAEKAVIVFGDGQGDVIDVCANKKACAKHWPEHQPAAKTAKAKKRGNDPYHAGTPAYAARLAKDEAERTKRVAVEARWKKLGPALREAMLAQAKKAITPGMIKVVASRFRLPSGTTVKTLIPAIVASSVDQYSWNWPNGEQTAIAAAKAFGVDVKAVEKVALKPDQPQTAPAATPASERGITSDKKQIAKARKAAAKPKAKAAPKAKATKRAAGKKR